MLVVQYSLRHPPPAAFLTSSLAPCYDDDDDDATFAPLAASAAVAAAASAALDQFAGHRTACQTSWHSPLTGSVGDSASCCRIHLIS